MEKKSVNLRFINYQPYEIKRGMFVGLHNCLPISAGDFGVIKDIKDDLLGFKYGVHELYDDKIFYHHISMIKPILPVLTSVEPILESDSFYFEGEIRTVIKRHKNGNNVILTSVSGHEYLEKWCEKVVATNLEIGWQYYNGPPHDHAYSYRKGAMVELYHPSMIYNIVRNKYKLKVDAITVCPNYRGAHIGKDCSCKSGFITVPYLFEGKVVMHIKKKKTNV